MSRFVVLWTVATFAFGCAGAIDEGSEDVKQGGGGQGGLADSAAGAGKAGGQAAGGSGGGVVAGGGAGGDSAGTGGALAAAGTSGAAGMAGAGGMPAVVDPPLPSGHPTLLMVGWGGVRVISRDLGKTWTNRVSITNEQYGSKGDLLRSAIWGEGMFVTIGDKIFTSPDGIAWTERQREGAGFVAELAHGNGMFVGGGGCASTLWSEDGITWKLGDSVPDRCDNHLRSAAFGNGQFAVAGDKSIVYVSPNARNWQVYPGLQTRDVKFCDGKFRDGAECPAYVGDGPWVKLGGFSIDYSEDNKTWSTVHKDTNRTTVLIYGYPN